MSVAVSQHKNFVGGEWVDSSGGETMEVLNPSTGEVIAEVARSTAEDADRAVEAAKNALPEWLDSTPGERAELLLKLADVIEENAEELAALESKNVGKPLSYARDEMPVSADNIRFFAGAARVLEGRAAGEYMRGYTSMLRREPIGVVAGIAPWNYPLMMAVWKFSPALAAGNVQVLKPSEQTPLTLLRFMELAADVIPSGVLNVITGDGVPVGEALVKHSDVRLVSLTGDVETGKAIARTAADNLKRVHLELGGKAPVVVFDDADPAAVAEAIKIAGYWNSGQDCTAASRVVAGPKIYDKLIEELVPAVESLLVGDPAEGDEIEMGPVISKAQQDRVLGFLERAEAARPYLTSLAQAIAWSSSANFWTLTTGPKTSRWMISLSCSIPVTTVGLTKKPRSPFESPPVRIVAIDSLARSRKPTTRSCWSFEITGPISISSPSAGSPTCSDSTAGTSSSMSLS